MVHRDPVLLSALSGDLIKIKELVLHVTLYLYSNLYLCLFSYPVPVLLSALSGELIKIKAVQLKPAQARQTSTATEKEEILMLHT